MSDLIRMDDPYTFDFERTMSTYGEVYRRVRREPNASDMRTLMTLVDVLKTKFNAEAPELGLIDPPAIGRAVLDERTRNANKPKNTYRKNRNRKNR